MLKKFVLAALLLASAFAPAAAMERIERFLSDAAVQRNGDLLVTETIQVRAELNQIRHGILRDFPTVYHRRDGSRVEVGFIVTSVTRDGLTEPYSTEKMANGVRVRIGSSDTALTYGSHTYVIHYRTTRQIGFFENFDELYWNATGNGWTFIIDSAEARITLPDRVEIKQAAFYTGKQGAQGKDATIVEQVPGRIVFRTTRVLPVANGLTVAAAFPKGVVVPPTTTQRLGAMLEDDPALPYAVLGGGAVMMFYFVAWFLVGRDPGRGTIIPLFGPPEGMSAAAVRFVSRMEFDNKAFAAAIVGLGVNGHLKLTDIKGEQELHHVAGGKPLDPAEKAVEDALFTATGLDTVPIDQSQHKTMFNAKFALLRALQKAHQGTLFKTNALWSNIGLAAALLVTAAICFAYYDSYNSIAPALLCGILIPIVPVAFGAGLIRYGRRASKHGFLQILLGIVVIVLGVFGGFATLNYNIGDGLAIVPGMVPWLLTPFASLGYGWLEAPTPQGRKVMDHIEGFRRYLSVAEEDRLEALNPPQKTPELFERFLPYAIALDVQNQWAKRFTGVLAAAAIAPAAAAAWYQSDQPYQDDVVGFADSLGDTFTNSIAAATVAPGSSGGSGGGDSFSSGGGSSGGGDSGGGGGGGGGSGW